MTVRNLSAAPSALDARPAPPFPTTSPPEAGDLADVRGQEAAKRALEIAAAGGHHLMLIGPPGAGKTMLARRLPGILPPLTRPEALEVTRIHSGVSGEPLDGLVSERPWRAPHPTTSSAAILGGGPKPVPGEVSLAHGGVLFLDELPEFRRATLQALCPVLDDGEIRHHHAGREHRLPARFSLVVALNPCPCGHQGGRRDECSCSPARIARYRGRISGALLDRIDLHMDVPAVTVGELRSARGEPSSAVAERVARARAAQQERFGPGCPTPVNAPMGPEAIARYCRLDTTGQRLLDTALDRLGLSARAHDRILAVARTIADLAGNDSLHPAHVAEAIQYRAMFRRVE